MIKLNINNKAFYYFRHEVHRKSIHGDFYPFSHRGDGFARAKWFFNQHAASYCLYGDEVIRETILFMNNAPYFRPIVDII